MSPARGTRPYLAGLRGLIRGPKSRTAPVEQQVTGPEPEQCCVCGSPETPYENYRGQLFCWPCANCPCGQTPCVRTGKPEHAVEPELPTDLTSLLDQHVKVTSPDNVTWRGRLIALADHPTLLLEEAPGVAFLLPQAYRVEAFGERPDESGPDPDTARTDPDTTQQGAADQGGHDPDDLRTRLADVIDEGFRTFDQDKTEDASLIESLTDSVLAFLQSRTQRLEAQLAQVEDILRIAHDTSNRSEAERARAVQRARSSEAFEKRLREQHHIDVTKLNAARSAVWAARACGEAGLCDVCSDGGGHLAAIEAALDSPAPETNLTATEEH